MGLFRLKKGCGNHSGEGNKIYKSGDVIDSASDLQAKFPFKFEKVEMGQGPQATPPEGPKPSSGALTPPPPDLPSGPAPAQEVNTTPTPALETRGKDVTKRFPKAQEQEFLVFSRDGSFWVYEVDDGTCLNEKGLKKTEVDAFIANYLRG